MSKLFRQEVGECGRKNDLRQWLLLHGRRQTTAETQWMQSATSEREGASSLHPLPINAALRKEAALASQGGFPHLDICKIDSGVVHEVGALLTNIRIYCMLTVVPRRENK